MARNKGQKIFGKKLAEIRDAGYTQEEFATLSKISRSTLGRYETAEVVSISKSAFRRIAAVLKITPDELEKKIGASQEPTTGYTNLRVKTTWLAKARAQAGIHKVSLEKLLEAAVSKGIEINFPDAPSTKDEESASQTDSDAKS